MRKVAPLRKLLFAGPVDRAPYCITGENSRSQPLSNTSPSIFMGKDVVGSSCTVARIDAAQRAAWSFDFSRDLSGRIVTVELAAETFEPSSSAAIENGARKMSIAWQRASGSASAM